MKTIGSDFSQHLRASEFDPIIIFKYFRFTRIDKGIKFFIKLFKLVFKYDGFHKCDNSQFSYLDFTIWTSNLYSFLKNH